VRVLALALVRVLALALVRVLALVRALVWVRARAGTVRPAGRFERAQRRLFAGRAHRRAQQSLLRCRTAERRRQQQSVGQLGCGWW